MLMLTYTGVPFDINLFLKALYVIMRKKEPPDLIGECLVVLS